MNATSPELFALVRLLRRLSPKALHSVRGVIESLLQPAEKPDRSAQELAAAIRNERAGQ